MKKPANQNANLAESSATIKANELHQEYHDQAVEEAKLKAQRPSSIQELKDALEEFEREHECYGLRINSKRTVFAEGGVNDSIMMISKAPGDEEDDDDRGLPFVGEAGVCLKKTINEFLYPGNSPGDSPQGVYFTNVMPWKLKGSKGEDREPVEREIDIMRPFVQKHVKLVAPKVVVLLGNAACKCLIPKHTTKVEAGFEWEVGIEKLREEQEKRQQYKKGHLYDYDRWPVWVTYNPAYLLWLRSKEQHAERKEEFRSDIKALQEYL